MQPVTNRTHPVKIAPILLLLLLAALALVGCDGAPINLAIVGETATAAPIAAAPSTTVPAPAALPTLTPVPTIVPFTSTPSANPTAAPPSATPTSIFAPPAPPRASPAAMGLKPLTEEELWLMVRASERGLYPAGNHTLTLARELIRRFPNGQRRNEAEWVIVRKLVDSDRNTLPVTIFANTIAHTLNANKAQPATLDTFLATQGFSLTFALTTTNLFSDNKPAVILAIRTAEHVPDYAEIVLVLTGSRTGEYDLWPLFDNWQPITDRGYTRLASADWNGNTQPEISYLAVEEGHAACSMTFTLYEWRAGKFAVLYEDEELSDYEHLRCGPLWRFETGAAGDQLLVSDLSPASALEGCAKYPRFTVYRWNGERYDLFGRRTPSFAEAGSPRCALSWANDAADDGYYAQAITLTRPALAQWLPDYVQIWGPASADYFRFKLGAWYALDGQFATARTTLQQVRDHPVHRSYTLTVQMASAYLTAYTSATRVADGCTAAQDLISEAGETIQPQADSDVLKSIVARLGFSERDWYVFTALDIHCHGRRALLPPTVAQTIRPATAKDLQDRLRALNVPVWAVARADLTGDGSLDWLIVESEDWGLSALLSEGGQPNLVFIGGLLPTESIAPVLRRVPHGKQDGWLNVFTLGENELRFRVVPDLPGNPPFRSFSAELIEQSEPDPLIPPEPESFFEQQTRIVAAIEHAIFETTDASPAINPLQTLLAGTIITDSGSPAPSKVYLRYLLGLAYELSGNPKAAVETYWLIWQEYPDDLYAAIVRRRLAPP